MNEANHPVENTMIKGQTNRSVYIVANQGVSPSKIHQNLLADYPVRYIGSQQILDTYFDDDNHCLFRQGLSCCLRETAGKLAICLIPIDALAMGRPGHSTITQELSGDEFFCELDTSVLPEGEAKELLMSVFGSSVVGHLFRARTYRRHYQVDFGGAVRYATLDNIDVCRNAKPDKQIPSLKYAELSFLTDPAFQHDADHFISAVVEQFSLTRSVNNLYRRAMHHDGTLKNLYTQHVEKMILESGVEAQVFGDDLLEKISLIEYWQGVAIEGVDSEGVHQMRVNIRRIRSALKLFSSLLSDSDVQHWQEEFRWLGKRLASVRDADVLLEWLQVHKDESQEAEKHFYDTYQSDIKKLRNQARAMLINSLDGDRYAALISGFRKWLETGNCFKSNSDIEYSDASDLAEKLLRRSVRKTARIITEVHRDSEAEALHDVRIQSKRLRYATDMLSSWSEHSYKSAKNVCRDLQAILGEHQDACDSTHRIRAYALSHAAAGHGQDYVFFLGKLFEVQQQRIETYRNKFFEIQKHSEKKLSNYL